MLQICGDMFRGCSKLTTIDLRNFDITNVTNVNSMFEYVPKTIKIITNENTKTLIQKYYPDFDITTV